MSNLDVTNRMARNFGGSWTHRRRIIYATLFFCAFCILYLMFWGSDTSRLQETIANSAFFLAGGVIGSYVFGAVWDDKGPAPSDKANPITTTPNQVQTGELVGGTDNVDNPDEL